tara:strand:- start:4288 stop:4980 length:693 start_codon:yes stop_codon:yes gene_type:complete
MNFIKKIYYNKYVKKSYSISNVDLVIDRMFANIDKGIYVDVGCNHPIKFNNTYLLYRRGWRGINIDFDSKSIKEFKKYRPKDYSVEKIVSNDEEMKDIYIYHERSAINTLSKDLVNYRKNKPKEIAKGRSTTLGKIIDESPFKGKKINLISIDIENHEYEVLKDFDFGKYKIDVIVTEWTDLTQNKLEIYNQSIEKIQKSKIYNLFIKNNYKLINWVNSDLVFARRDFNI